MDVLKVVNPRCEYKENFIGINVMVPRFSWPIVFWQFVSPLQKAGYFLSNLG